MANEKIIVLVSDRGDSKHGEISVLDDPRKAERLVETLLEAGFAEDRIRVFTGQASEFEVNHRPVVALMSEGTEGEAQPSAQPNGHETETEERPAEIVAHETATPEPAAEPPGDETATPEPVAESATNQAATPEPSAETRPEDSDTSEKGIAETSEDEEVPAEAAASVKFSSLFRSA